MAAQHVVAQAGGAQVVPLEAAQVALISEARQRALPLQELSDRLRTRTADHEPDDLGRCSVEETQLTEIIVFGDHQKPVRRSAEP